MTAVSVAAAVLFFADLTVGSAGLSLREVWHGLVSDKADEVTRYIVLNFRIPKAVTALLVGAALSASGLQM